MARVTDHSSFTKSDAVADLKNRVRYHRPDQDAIEQIARMRTLALGWGEDIIDLVPAGREQALALTKIEEALFWCNAGIARHPDNWDEQQPEK